MLLTNCYSHMHHSRRPSRCTSGADLLVLQVVRQHESGAALDEVRVANMRAAIRIAHRVSVGDILQPCIPCRRLQPEMHEICIAHAHGYL